MKKTLVVVLAMVLVAGLVLPVAIVAAGEPDMKTNVDTEPTPSSDTIDFSSGDELSIKNPSTGDLDTENFVWAIPHSSQNLPEPSESEIDESQLPESEPHETEPPVLPEPSLPFEISAPDQVNQGANIYVEGKIYLPMPDVFGGSFLNYHLVFELEGQGKYGSSSVYWTPPYAGEVRFRIKIKTEDIPTGTYRLISHLNYAVRFPEEDVGYIVWSNLDTGLMVTINPGLLDDGHGEGFIDHLISVLQYK